MADLKVCPFCGGRAGVKKFVSRNGVFEVYNVYCMNEDCAVEPITHDYYHKGEAIEAWNNRVSQTVVNQFGENCTHISNCGTLNLNL